jgi:hypothetical protein
MLGVLLSFHAEEVKAKDWAEKFTGRIFKTAGQALQEARLRFE